MVLGTILLAGSTVASLALPYFFPPQPAEAKPAQKPTITTYTTQNSGRKILVNTTKSKIVYPQPKPEPILTQGRKTGVIIIAIVIALIFLMLVLRK